MSQAAHSGQLNEAELSPVISTAGLPNRTKVILEREKNQFRIMVDVLMDVGKREPFDGEPAFPLTLPMLETGFISEEAFVVSAASWLAGRCEGSQAAESRIEELLQNFIKSKPADNLDIWTQAYAETAMSIALRGDQETCRNMLLPLVTKFATPNSETYLAAYYLAQLGDPVGYPSILATLQSKNEHYRLMAARHLIAFKPYQGQIIEGQKVDVSGLLLECLKDRHVMVRTETPFLLAEIEVENLPEKLKAVIKNDKSKEVRRAAQFVLDNTSK